MKTFPLIIKFADASYRLEVQEKHNSGTLQIYLVRAKNKSFTIQRKDKTWSVNAGQVDNEFFKIVCNEIERMVD